MSRLAPGDGTWSDEAEWAMLAEAEGVGEEVAPDPGRGGRQEHRLTEGAVFGYQRILRNLAPPPRVADRVRGYGCE